MVVGRGLSRIVDMMIDVMGSSFTEEYELRVTIKVRLEVHVQWWYHELLS
jgi:hypothetical protein